MSASTCWSIHGRNVCPLPVLRNLGTISINCIQTSRWSESVLWWRCSGARWRIYRDATYINGEGSVKAIEVAVFQFVWIEVRRQTKCMPRDPIPELVLDGQCHIVLAGRWTEGPALYQLIASNGGTSALKFLLATIMAIDLPGLGSIACPVCLRL